MRIRRGRQRDGEVRGGSKEGLQEKIHNSEKTGRKDKSRGTPKTDGMR